jgi:hypothetical protein
MSLSPAWQCVSSADGTTSCGHEQDDAEHQGEQTRAQHRADVEARKGKPAVGWASSARWCGTRGLGVLSLVRWLEFPTAAGMLRHGRVRLGRDRLR